MGTTFKQFSPGNYAGYDYGRSGNPTRNTLEQVLASLEKAKYGFAFSSGLGALTTLSYLLKTGDHIVTVVFYFSLLLSLIYNNDQKIPKNILTLTKDDVYGGTNRFFRNCANRMGIETSFVNMLDLKETENSFKENTAVRAG